MSLFRMLRIHVDMNYAFRELKRTVVLADPYVLGKGQETRDLTQRGEFTLHIEISLVISSSQ